MWWTAPAPGIESAIRCCDDESQAPAVVAAQKGGCRWENEAAYVRSRTAGVMTTLMRNGRDRRSENPSGPTRYLSACYWLGPISGSHQGQRPQRPHRTEVSLQAKTGRIHGCTRTLRKEVRFFPCTAGAVHTWPDSPVSGPQVLRSLSEVFRPSAVGGYEGEK